MIPNIADTVPKVKYQEIILRNWIMKIIFQAFKIPDDAHYTWQKLAIFSEGVQSSYKYEERQWH